MTLANDWSRSVVGPMAGQPVSPEGQFGPLRKKVIAYGPMTETARLRLSRPAVRLQGHI